MKISTINKLCCPFDKADLSLQVITRDMENHIIEGILTCCKCNRYYPIVKGVPIMSPDEYREFKLEQPLLDNWQVFIGNKEVAGFRLIATNHSPATE